MKCSPAVGAATEPSSRAKTVWYCVAVLCAVGTIDVGRQRHVANAIHGSPKITAEAQRAFSKLTTLDNLRGKFGMLGIVAKKTLLPDAELSARTHQRLPLRGIDFYLSRQQT